MMMRSTIQASPRVLQLTSSINSRYILGNAAANNKRKCQQSFSRRFKASQAGPSTAATTTTSSAAATTTRSLPLASRMWKSYSSSLERRPLLTKTSAAALIFFSSDSATQKLMDPEESWDAARSSSGAVFGVVATCYLHFWWGFLESTIGSVIPAARSRLANTAVKVLIDQGAGAPLYIYTYYIMTNSIQKMTSSSSSSSDPRNKKKIMNVLEETESRARHMLWPTMLQHWKLWPAVHSFNFYFIPLQHRVLLQNTVLVGWSGYLSHLNKTGIPEIDGKLMTPKEEIESTIIQRRKTIKSTTS